MSDRLEFAYYMGNEAEQYTFYRVPKLLFTGEMFRTVSCEAKVLYGLLLDRMGLSIKNRWLDEADRVYIMFPVGEIMELLGIGTQKASKLLKELENIGLIERKRLGLGKPNIIYVKNFKASENPDKEEENPDEYSGQETENDLQMPVNSLIFPNQKTRIWQIKNQEFGKSKNKNFENQKSRISQMEKQEFRKSKSNDTDMNDNNINNTDSNKTEINNIYTGGVISINPIYQGSERPLESDTGIIPESPENVRQTDTEAVEEAYRSLIHSNISYPSLASSSFYSKQELDELVELMIDIIMLPDDDSVRINGSVKSARVVKSHLLKLNQDHMEYVLHCLKANTGKVYNIKSYLLTALYNAPLTMDNFYRAEANHDCMTAHGT